MDHAIKEYNACKDAIISASTNPDETRFKLSMMEMYRAHQETLAKEEPTDEMKAWWASLQQSINKVYGFLTVTPIANCGTLNRSQSLGDAMDEARRSASLAFKESKYRYRILGYLFKCTRKNYVLFPIKEPNTRDLRDLSNYMTSVFWIDELILPMDEDVVTVASDSNQLKF
jgi:hypothetical protein